MNTTQQKLFGMFHPYALQKRQELIERSGRFVHYTSAEAAFSILSSRQVWMRKSSIMNDFSEIRYGKQLLSNALDGPPGNALRKALDAVFPGSFDSINSQLDLMTCYADQDTFITSISEHDDDEDSLGRLSMWRAYGGSAGVALVMNNTAFTRPSDALRAYTSPVAYFDKSRFFDECMKIAKEIEREASFLLQIGRETTEQAAVEMMRQAILCTKHRGFREEREWRVVYSPAVETSTKIKCEIKSVRGIPQPVCLIPLENYPEEDFIGAEISDLIDRIIIGPTQYPSALYEAFCRVLTAAGVTSPHRLISVSDIPLRT